MGGAGSEMDILREELNGQTARIDWSELERHFARGVVIWVAPEMDLVDIAVMVASDDQARIKILMAAGKFIHVTDEQAQDWSDRKPELWAVVTAPWILVQERGPLPA